MAALGSLVQGGGVGSTPAGGEQPPSATASEGGSAWRGDSELGMEEVCLAEAAGAQGGSQESAAGSTQECGGADGTQSGGTSTAAAADGEEDQGRQAGEGLGPAGAAPEGGEAQELAAATRQARLMQQFTASEDDLTVYRAADMDAAAQVRGRARCRLGRLACCWPA